MPTPTPVEATAVHVADLDGAATSQETTWTATLTIEGACHLFDQSLRFENHRFQKAFLFLSTCHIEGEHQEPGATGGH